MDFTQLEGSCMILKDLCSKDLRGPVHKIFARSYRVFEDHEKDPIRLP